jgi:Flp pilus assembly protein CpaB
MALSQKGPQYNRLRKGRAPAIPLEVMAAGGVALFVAVVALAIHLLRAPSDAAVDSSQASVEVFTTEILVPIDTVQVGVALQPELFRKETRAEDQVTGDMVRGLDELKGMYSRGVLFKGQPILKAALTNKQPVHVLTALLPKGYRAVAIQVENPLLDNVDGWAQPGTDVDLVWITSMFGREMASILAGPVRVLASNKATEWSAAKKATEQGDKIVTVTLLLTVRDAVRVSLAAMYGKVSLGLLGLNDRRPNEGARPLSSVVEERASKQPAPSVLSVKILDPKSRGAEVRKYDTTGRRVTE